MPWEQVYEIEESAEYGGSYPLLMLPPTSAYRPCLGSQGSFSDPDFSVYISGWAGTDGVLLMEDPRFEGRSSRPNRKRHCWSARRGRP